MRLSNQKDHNHFPKSVRIKFHKSNFINLVGLHIVAEITKERVRRVRERTKKLALAYMSIIPKLLRVYVTRRINYGVVECSK